MSGDKERARNHVSAEALVDRLGLEPHPEGGFFRETFRSALTVAGDRGERTLSTAVLFLVTAGRPSRFHRLTAEELWLYQAGAPLELALLSDEEPEGRSVQLGHPVDRAPAQRGRPVPGQAAVAVAEPVPHLLVPAGAWQAARVHPSEGMQDWTLVTCVVSPGFDFDDFEMGDRKELLAVYPKAEELIVRHT